MSLALLHKLIIGYILLKSIIGALIAKVNMCDGKCHAIIEF